MSKVFLADPVVLRAEGEKLLNESVQFNTNVEKLYDTIHHLVQTGYVSSGARAIAQNIEMYRADLDAMTKTIKQYGQFCIASAGAVNKNEQRIMDELK